MHSVQIEEALESILSSPKHSRVCKNQYSLLRNYSVEVGQFLNGPAGDDVGVLAFRRVSASLKSCSDLLNKCKNSRIWQGVLCNFGHDFQKECVLLQSLSKEVGFSGSGARVEEWSKDMNQALQDDLAETREYLKDLDDLNQTLSVRFKQESTGQHGSSWGSVLDRVICVSNRALSLQPQEASNQESLESRLQTKESQIRQLQSNLQERSEAVAALTAKLQSKESEIVSLNSSLASKGADIKILESKLQKKASLEKSQNDEFEKAAARRESELEAEISTLQRDAVQKDREHSRKLKEAVDEKEKTLMAVIEDQVKENDRMSSEIKLLHSKLMQSRGQSSSEAINQTQAQHSELQPIGIVDTSDWNERVPRAQTASLAQATAASLLPELSVIDTSDWNERAFVTENPRQLKPASMSTEDSSKCTRGAAMSSSETVNETTPSSLPHVPKKLNSIAPCYIPTATLKQSSSLGSSTGTSTAGHKRPRCEVTGSVTVPSASHNQNSVVSRTVTSQTENKVSAADNEFSGVSHAKDHPKASTLEDTARLERKSGPQLTPRPAAGASQSFQVMDNDFEFMFEIMKSSNDSHKVIAATDAFNNALNDKELASTFFGRHSSFKDVIALLQKPIRSAGALDVKKVCCRAVAVACQSSKMGGMEQARYNASKFVEMRVLMSLGSCIDMDKLCWKVGKDVNCKETKVTQTACSAVGNLCMHSFQARTYSIRFIRNFLDLVRRGPEFYRNAGCALKNITKDCSDACKTATADGIIVDIIKMMKFGKDVDAACASEILFNISTYLHVHKHMQGQFFSSPNLLSEISNLICTRSVRSEAVSFCIKVLNLLLDIRPLAVFKLLETSALRRCLAGKFPSDDVAKKADALLRRYRYQIDHRRS